MPNQATLDLARRCEGIYADRLRPMLEQSHLHEYVAIEPESGDYFLGGTLSEAIQAARQGHPDRLAYALRVGHPSGVHLGVMAT